MDRGRTKHVGESSTFPPTENLKLTLSLAQPMKTEMPRKVKKHTLPVSLPISRSKHNNTLKPKNIAKELNIHEKNQSSDLKASQMKNLIQINFIENLNSRNTKNLSSGNKRHKSSKRHKSNNISSMIPEKRISKEKKLKEIEYCIEPPLPDDTSDMVSAENPNEINNNTILRDPVSTTKDETNFAHIEKKTMKENKTTQTDVVRIVSDEVDEILKALKKHRVIDIVKKKIRDLSSHVAFDLEGNDVVEIADTDSEPETETSNVSQLDESFMNLIVECSNKNKELVADMYSTAYTEAHKRFDRDGWSIVWKIMVKAVRLSINNKGSKNAPETNTSNVKASVNLSNKPNIQSSVGHPETPERINDIRPIGVTLLPPPPPPPPLPESEEPFQNCEVQFQHRELPAMTYVPTPMQTSMPTSMPMPRPSPRPAPHEIQTEKTLMQHLQLPKPSFSSTATPMTSNPNGFNQNSVQVALGVSSYPRPPVPNKVRQRRIESVQTARQQLAEHWLRHQMQTSNIPYNPEQVGNMPYTAPAPPRQKPISREQLVMYQRLMHTQEKIEYRNSHLSNYPIMDFRNAVL